MSSHLLTGIMALAMMALGWHYLFNSRAADAMAVIDSRRLNAWRVNLRRVGGVVMMLWAVAFYAGFNTVDWDHPTVAFVWVWLAVFILMGLSIVLALADMYLTHRSRVAARRRLEEKDS